VSDPSTRLSVFPPAAHSPLALGAQLDEAETTVRDFLGFAVAESRYAMELSAVQKVIKLPPLTEVPLAADEILGIVSVRGRVTTLFDARRLLRFPPAEPTSRSRVLLVNRGEETVGLLVDSVLQVYRLDESEIEPPAAAGAEGQSHVTGIGRPGRDDAEGEQPDEAGRKALPPLQPFSGADGTGPEEEMLILIDPVALLKG
jgi:purine-binding chemotaxis protein CheW